MIKVLVVEDSTVAREFLVDALHQDPSMNVVATAENGLEALREVARVEPDVITMDINMPKMDGLEATRRIMETCPTPIVIVSSNVSSQEAISSFHAIQAGALAVLQRPPGPASLDHHRAVAELIQTVKLMSEVKVVRRWPRPRFDTSNDGAPSLPRDVERRVRAVGIGASTGGPAALHQILAPLTKPFPIPILIVQHIARGFVHSFAEWLQHAISQEVRVAVHGEPLSQGIAYVAPDDQHMGVDAQHLISLSDASPEAGLRPAASHLFRSLAQTYGPQAAGILLTGMGRDGAEGMLQLRKSAGLTIAQDKASAVISSMPDQAVKLGAARFVMSPAEIVTALNQLAASHSSNS